MTINNSMSAHTLDLYFRHNLWSNLQLLDACMQLDAAQLAFAMPGTYGSIGLTLGHLVFAEERYIFHITRGKQATDGWRPTSTTALSVVRARAAASGATLLQLATTLDGSDHVRTGDDESLIPIAVLLLQAIHHGHEHRTQVESMLGQLGIEPPGLSGWRYFDEQMRS